MICISQYKEEDRLFVDEFYINVAKESNYLSFDYDEYKHTVHLNDLTYIAKLDNKIIGICTLNIDNRRKNCHVGILGIAIYKEFTNMKVGTRLIEHLLSNVKSNINIHKISLTVRSDNHIAISLYKKFGFSIEGELKEHVKVDKLYYNLYNMAYFIKD